MTRHDAKDGAEQKPLSALEALLGHRFADRELLQRALTHSSILNEPRKQKQQQTYESNERLEFLGDRVLGLVIAEMLTSHFPQAPEGELAQRLNALVREEACADVALKIGLGAYLVLATSEEKSGGRSKSAILGDACEAAIAALYLDGGLDVARRFIETQWASRLDHSLESVMDAKTALQHWTLKHKKGLPKYVTVEHTGPDHAPNIVVEVSVAGLDSIRGEGGSRRQAEQNAARALLIRENVWSGHDRS